MPRLAANLSWMFGEWPFLDRFGTAAWAGFRGVECLFPYEHPAESVAARLREHALELALFNLPPGDWQAGERGLAALPGRERDFAAAALQALDYARTVGARRLHVMAGVPPAAAHATECEAVMAANLRHAAALCRPHGIELLIEPINGRDMPGYFLQTQARALRLMEAVGAANLRLQLDLYHCQVVEGDLATRIHRHRDRIGHVQIAGVPERHEPDEGELNPHWLLALLDGLGYAGWVGCEYRPRAGTLEGLGWAERYGIGARR